ncbi:MAG TPA: hypothetical protein VFZ79_03090 [Acidimicrobiales bacterium]
MRRRPVVLASLALAAVVLIGAGPAAEAAPAQQPDAPAGAGQGDDAPATTAEPVPDQDIIPRPDSGREPAEAGDRGGALQALVFVLIVGGVVGIAAMAVRDARRHRTVRDGGDQPSGANSSQAS